MGLSLEQQGKIKRLDIQISFLQQAIFQKAGVTLVIASLSAAILIIASFSNDLLSPSSLYFKIAITILLSLIPTSLFVYLIEIFDCIHAANKNIEEITGLDSKVRQKEIEKSYSTMQKIRNKICGGFTYFSVSLLSLVMIYIIWEIWD